MFQISIVNRTLTISDLELHRVVRAVDRQVADDFAPYWGFGGRLRVEGPAGAALGHTGRPGAGPDEGHRRLVARAYY
jgi:hypothetical protein